MPKLSHNMEVMICYSIFRTEKTYTDLTDYCELEDFFIDTLGLPNTPTMVSENVICPQNYNVALLHQFLM